MVTIKDVARRARVSVSTVSRVLNEHPDVGAETRSTVLQVAKQLGYRPNSRARQLVRDNTETICFVLSNRDVMSRFHSRVLVGVEEYARAKSHSVIFIRYDYTPDVPTSEMTLPRVIWERSAVDGVILAGTNYPNFVNAVKSLSIPFVLFGNNLIGRMAMQDVDTVWFDNEGGARKATEYLLELGHTDIWLTADLGLTWYRRCFRGYSAAMREHGLEPKSLGGPIRGTVFEYGIGCADQIASLPTRPTAIVAGDDEIALGIMSGLKRHGIRVPEEISLVGFDDIDEIKFVHPALTTIHVPRHEVGTEMAELLFQKMADRSRPAVRHVLPTELVIRESTCLFRMPRNSTKTGYPRTS